MSYIETTHHDRVATAPRPHRGVKIIALALLSWVVVIGLGKLVWDVSMLVFHLFAGA